MAPRAVLPQTDQTRERRSRRWMPLLAMLVAVGAGLLITSELPLLLLEKTYDVWSPVLYNEHAARFFYEEGFLYLTAPMADMVWEVEGRVHARQVYERGCVYFLDSARPDPQIGPFEIAVAHDALLRHDIPGLTDGARGSWIWSRGIRCSVVDREVTYFTGREPFEKRVGEDRMYCVQGRERFEVVTQFRVLPMCIDAGSPSAFNRKMLSLVIAGGFPESDGGYAGCRGALIRLDE